MNEHCEILAAAPGCRPAVEGIAYSGGPMRLGGWRHPAVVDLAGMTLPETIPLLADHENHTTSRVGVVTPAIRDGSLEIRGEIAADGPLADGIVAQAKAGAEWQLSIGADVDSVELVQEGKRTVNGIEHAAPFYHITRSTLREVSVVAVGADRTTRMRVAASFTLHNIPEEITSMADTPAPTETPAAKPVEAAAAPNPQPQTPDPQTAAVAAVKAERERTARIRSICRGEFPDIEAKAVDEGWDADRATAAVLEAYRARMPAPAAPGIAVRPSPRADAKVLEAALSLRAGIDEDSLARDLGEAAVEAAMPDRDIPLRGLLCECLRLEGMDAPRSLDNQAIAAAFSTVSLPGILSNVAQKILLQTYRAQPVIATRLCSVGDLTDFKESDRYRLTDVGDLQPVAPDGEIKEGGLAEEAAKNQLDTYAKKFVLTRRMIINDDLGAFLRIPAAMGNRAARLIDQLFFRRLMENPVQADGKALFHAGHRNLLTGASSALSADSLKKAIQGFLDQTDVDGQPVSVEPRTLLVPTALRHLAVELTRGTTLIMSGAAEPTLRPALNVLADENLQVVSSPYLGNAAYPGSSTASWYLFGDPAQVDTFEIGYLKGRRTPTVEHGDMDFNVLGMWFRVYFDVGVREQDHRGMLKANGAA